ncbi:hypothetical protein T09_14491 [Trichinella sp. T9]|nr:hypothetical protein T09_14491 [Trichinella sp. T9]
MTTAMLERSLLCRRQLLAYNGISVLSMGRIGKFCPLFSRDSVVEKRRSDLNRLNSLTRF